MPAKPKKQQDDMAKHLGVGLDVGTMNLVSARKTDKGIETRRMRDAFLDLPPESKKMLKLSGVSYVDRGDEILILGDAALDTANIFGREARRPLSGGLVSSTETDSLEVLGLLVRNVLGEPAEEGEHCYFSVPAAPIASLSSSPPIVTAWPRALHPSTRASTALRGTLLSMKTAGTLRSTITSMSALSSRRLASLSVDRPWMPRTEIPLARPK